MAYDGRLWPPYAEHLRDTEGLASQTVQEYRRALGSFWDFIAPRPPNRARSADLARFARRRALTGPERVLAPETARAYCIRVRRFYAWAAATGLLRRDPLALAARLPRGRAMPRDVPPELVARALEEISDERVRLAVALGYFAGLRIGEIVRLEVGDVRTTAPAQLFIARSKGAKDRVMPVHAALGELLDAYLRRRPSTGPLLARLDDPTRPLKRDYASQLVAQALHAFGLERGGAHRLRHTFLTELARSGAGLYAMRDLAGHESLATTELYTRGFSPELTSTVALLRDPRRPSRQAALRIVK